MTDAIGTWLPLNILKFLTILDLKIKLGPNGAKCIKYYIIEEGSDSTGPLLAGLYYALATAIGAMTSGGNLPERQGSVCISL